MNLRVIAKVTLEHVLYWRRGRFCGAPAQNRTCPFDGPAGASTALRGAGGAFAALQRKTEHVLLMAPGALLPRSAQR